MLPDASHIMCIILDMLPGVDLYYTHPLQCIITAGWELNDLGRDLSDLSVRIVAKQRFHSPFTSSLAVNAATALSSAALISIAFADTAAATASPFSLNSADRASASSRTPRDACAWSSNRRRSAEAFFSSLTSSY